MNLPPRLPCLLLSVSFSLCFSTLPLRAQTTFTWTNSGAGNWNDAGNWDNGLPILGALVTIDNGGTARLPAGVTGTAALVTIGTVGGSSGTIVFSGGELTPPLGSTSFVVLGRDAGSSGKATMNGGHWSTSSLTVGLNGSGTLEMSDGLLESALGVSIAAGAGAAGTATITGGTLQTYMFALAGDGGTGTMTVQDGAIESTHAVIGDGTGSEATVTIGGTGSWTNSDLMTLGVGGTGTLNLNGGSVQNGTTIIGGGSGGIGSLIMTDGTFTSNGGVSVSDDPDVPDDLPTSVGVQALIVGSGASGTGSLTMNGGQASVTGQMIVGGGAASGSVTVNAGTLSVSDITFVGAGATTSGTNILTIDGTGSFSGKEVQVGYGNAGAPDSSAQLVIAGGSTDIDGGFSLQIEEGSGLVIGTGFAIGSLQGTGTFVQSGGSLATAEAVIGLLGGTGTARISGGTWTNSGTLRIGYSDSALNATILGGEDPSSIDLTGTGTLTIEGAGVVSTPTVTLATHAGDTGTLNIGAYDLSTTGGTLNTNSVVFGDGAGALNFNQTDTVTFGADISGGGSVTQRGGGTTVLTGNATHTGGTTISGGTLQIGDGGTTGSVASDIVNHGSLVFNRGDTLTYGGVISGVGNVTKTGAGVLMLTNDSSYTGQTWISGGSMFLTGGASLATGSGDLFVGRNGTGSLIVQAGASVATDKVSVGVNAGDVGTVSLSDTFTASELVIGDSGTGTLTLAQNGSLFVNDGTGIITLGDKFGGRGTLAFGSSGASGTTDAVTITGGLGGGTVKFDHTGEFILGANLTENLAVTKISNGTTILTGINTYTGGTTIAGGVLRAGSTTALAANTAYAINAGTLDLNNHALTVSSLSGDGGAITLGSATLTVDQTASTAYAGAIGGDGGLTKLGAGSLTLSGTSAYTGTTAVNGGTLNLTGALITGGLGIGRADGATASVAVSGAGAGATLRIEGGSPSFLTVGDNAGSTGTLTVGNGGLVALADGAKLTVGWNGAGTLNLNSGGVIEIGGTADGLQQGSGGTTINLAGGTLRVGNGFTTSVPLALASTSTLDVTTGGATFSGALTGPGGLVKTGAGTLTLDTANAYTGATTISAGILKLGASSSLANTSGIALSSGASFDVSAVDGFTLGAAQTLSGGGFVVGAVTVAGTLAPGASPGLLTFDDNLTLAPTATLLFQLGGDERGVTYDAIDVGGDLTYGGNIEFSLIDGATLAAGNTFRIFDVAGGHTGAFDRIQFADPGLTGIFDYATGSLQITAVPEPATCAAILGALALLGAAWRRCLTRRKID